ncbi:unnamed protein product [Thelazia callipaeda]|uniref:OGG_N domain-containing protein n=1 Tax=Thelazia callipaeda TaxID=103827 RepID=A0A0N5D875_THECL|nr:unnamed protein product [Thelazia callipaeda]
MPLLNCVKEELNLANVLLSGQSFRIFRWVKVLESDDAYNSIHDTFIGVAQHRVWKLRRENDKQVYYEVLGKFSEAIGDDHDTLRNYFQLDVDLNHLYKYWSENDEHFAELMKSYRNDLEGIRILCQDPLETVFAFICSSNNHIKRITNMVEILCELYGESITVPYYGKLKKFYDFADPRLMADDRMLEITLRNHGFGYRAPSIAYAAKALVNIV